MNKCFIWGGFLAPLFFINISFSGGGNGSIDGFSFVTCGKTKCIHVSSPQASVSGWTGNFALKNNQIKIFDKSSHQTVAELNSKDTYIDFVTHRIYIRDLENHKSRDAIYNLNSENLQFL